MTKSRFKRLCVTVSTLLITSLVGASSVYADTVVLSDGNRLVGKVVEANQINIVLLLNGQESVLPRSSVTRIEFDAQSKPASTVAPDIARTIVNGQNARLRVSAWSPPSSDRKNVYGVFYQLLNELRLSEKDRLPAGTMLYGTVTLSAIPGREAQFVKNIEGAFESRRRLRITHGAVSQLRVLPSTEGAKASVVFSPGGATAQPGGPTSSETVDSLPWLKVGNVLEWSFLAK